MKLLFASNNAKKLNELRQLVEGIALEVVSPDEMGIELDVVEDGASFFENAKKKAEAFAKISGLWSLADDSGLCVDALDGHPGVLSARYAEGTDEDRYRKLLHAMRSVPDEKRQAHFVCALWLANPVEGGHREGESVEGRCDGVILREPRGTHGFGYDPVFEVPAFGKSMAELKSEEKNRISHRAKAFERIRPRLVALAMS